MGAGPPGENCRLFFEMTEVLALIPARGGSKSIPRKNILEFAGYPLIAYSIASALAAETVTRVVVSTDDDEISRISRHYGAETPFTRPYQPEIIVQLRPTSPLRRVQHIDEAVYRLLERPGADSVRTVCVPFQNPFKMWRIGSNGFTGRPVMSMQPGLIRS